MFAIQWALVICNIISCIPGIPAFIYKEDSEKFHKSTAAFFNEGASIMSNEADLPFVKLLFKFLFVGLAGIYVLGIFAGFYAPAVAVGYAFAAGNLLRVAYIGVKVLDGETWIKGNFSNKQIGVICIVQTVLGLVLLVCTLVSSMNDEYQVFAADMAESAEAKWETDGFYCKLIFGAACFFVLVQAPGVIAPGIALKQFQPVEAKQATDKQAIIVLEFVMGFQQLSILMTQALVAVFVWYMPTVIGLAIWCLTFYTLYYPILIFVPTILNADKYGMDRLPMIIFLIMNVFMGGVSLLAIFG